MMIKFYYYGKSNRYNDMFYPLDEKCGIAHVTIPYAAKSIRDIVSSKEDELGLYGFKRCLYLERSENTRRYWKIVMGIWNSEDEFCLGDDPERVVRFTVDDFDYMVKDKFTGEYIEELPLKVYYRFLDTGERTFY